MLPRRGMLLAAVAAVLTLAAGHQAQAAFGDFTYSTTVTMATATNTNSQILQTGQPLTGPQNAVGGTDVVVGTAAVQDVTGITGVPYSDTYSSGGAYNPITVAVTINNVDGGSGVVTFTGNLLGTVTFNGTTFSSSFSNPGFAPSGSDSVDIGTTRYTVTADPTKDFSAPGAPSAPGGTGAAGSYTFTVTATNIVPEPASMALLGIGSMGLVFLVRRRRAQV